MNPRTNSWALNEAATACRELALKMSLGIRLAKLGAC
jgi:hypothetical protein